MAEIMATDRERLAEMVKDQRLSFVAYRHRGGFRHSVHVHRGDQSEEWLGEIAVGESGGLSSDITDHPEIELVLEYIRQCLLAYRDVHAGLMEREEGGSKLYLLYNASAKEMRNFNQG